MVVWCLQWRGISATCGESGDRGDVSQRAYADSLQEATIVDAGGKTKG